MVYLDRYLVNINELLPTLDSILYAYSHIVLSLKCKDDAKIPKKNQRSYFFQKLLPYTVKSKRIKLCFLMRAAVKKNFLDFFGAPEIKLYFFAFREKKTGNIYNVSF